MQILCGRHKGHHIDHHVLPLVSIEHSDDQAVSIRMEGTSCTPHCSCDSASKRRAVAGLNSVPIEAAAVKPMLKCP